MSALHSHCRPFVPAAQAGARRPAGRGAAVAPVTCRLGGGPGGGQPGSGQPPRLIIPGSDQGSGGPRKLVFPKTAGEPGGRPGYGGPDPAQPTAATPAQFRPPPGFMDAVGRPTLEEPDMSTDEMLNRLRSNAGHWHQLANLLPALARAGVDSTVVEEMVGLERRLQNVWTGAEQVYESVRKSGELPPNLLAHFDGEGGESLLYELRFLSIRQRVQAARYIAEEDLTAQEALVLARAVKDHERRDGTKEGFSSEPGDCLAYKFYRDAIECRRREDAELCVQKGLEVVVTEPARNKLASMLSEQDAALEERPNAVLTMLRMTKDELGHRIVAVPGSLQDCSPEGVLSAPKASSEGVFGNFRVPPSDHQWVALPNWSLLQLAGHPVALSISNCAEVPQIRAASSAKTDDELRRLSGSGLAVVDLAPDTTTISADAYYLTAGPDGRLQLQEGGTVSADDVLGLVLFVCRPPSRDGGLAGSTSELLSL